MLVLAISAVGVIAVGSTRKDLQLRQIEGVILGLLVMVVISFMDYKWLLKFYWLMYAANLVLLISVLLLEEQLITQNDGYILALLDSSHRILQKFC